MLVIKAATDKVLPELQKYGGTVYQTSLSNEDEEKLKKAWSMKRSAPRPIRCWNWIKARGSGTGKYLSPGPQSQLLRTEKLDETRRPKPENGV